MTRRRRTLEPDSPPSIPIHRRNGHEGQSPADGHRVAVLVVEDDADQRELVARALQRHGFDVTVVADGPACMAAVASGHFALILLDYSLPRMNGLEVLAELRARGVPAAVVMVTAQGDERLAVDAMKAGSTDFVVKTTGYLVSLTMVLRKALKQQELAAENERLHRETAERLREAETLAAENARLYEQTQATLEELRDTQELLVRGETLRALGELAGGAAHHLNNLLAVIAGRSQLLLRSVDSGPLRRPLEIIERTAHDGAEVVRRIQQFSRWRQLEAPEPVDVNQVIRDVIEMTRARWHDSAVAQGVTIGTSCDLEPVPPVAGHAAALRELVTNFVLNAVDALPAGGEIHVRTRREGRLVAFTVTDTGVGMSDAVKRRALEPFFTTKGVKSTGLGLSVNYGIVQQHGGELLIESAEGRGTAVTVRLPAAEAAEAPVADARPAAGPLRVLLVDDEPDVREALGDLLGDEGHVVLHASDASHALAALERQPLPDLVLTDHGMPAMTGCELVRVIKARWPGLPVALVTGWRDEAMLAEAQLAGVDFVLGKPIDVHQLRAHVADVARRSTREGA